VTGVRELRWVKYGNGEKMHAVFKGRVLCGKPLDRSYYTPFHDDAITPLCQNCRRYLADEELAALRLSDGTGEGDRARQGEAASLHG
jgi:hypothetical protein